jgi:hypothetical protein
MQSPNRPAVLKTLYYYRSLSWDEPTRRLFQDTGPFTQDSPLCNIPGGFSLAYPPLRWMMRRDNCATEPGETAYMGTYG